MTTISLKAENLSELCDGVWDDSLLVKAYKNSVKMAREELARRISLSTNNNPKNVGNWDQNLRVGDYARATYEDGIDYEAKILSIDKEKGTCILKYIGYDNEQEVSLCDLIASWGKKARRAQFVKAKNHIQQKDKTNAPTTNKSSKSEFVLGSLPPTPPMPPLMLKTRNLDSAENLSAMLMSWYMSGYYTGIYEGQQIANQKDKNYN